MTTQPYLVSRLQGFGTTIFAQMSALATQHNAINLGQGFPDTDGPPEIMQAAVDAIRAGHNQYPPGLGIPQLRQAVADHQQRFYDVRLNPDSEVLITAGATEAITSAVLSLCEMGDEVVLFEPYYDSYAAAVALAGAQRRCVKLSPPDWSFDPADLEQAISQRTRLIILNTPHNPTGKVFSAQELSQIAQAAQEHNLLVLTDEVYEHIVFNDTPAGTNSAASTAANTSGGHIPIATLPNMADRTITVSSAGKTFSCTGWKIGWATGPETLIKATTVSKQFLTYVNGAPFQHAVVEGLRLDDSYFKQLATDLQVKRDILCEGLTAAGMKVLRPQGTYFAVAEIPSSQTDGTSLCFQLPELCGVAAVPLQSFCDMTPGDAPTGDAHPGAPTPAFNQMIRFAFCKQPEVLTRATKRLAQLALTS